MRFPAPATPVALLAVLAAGAAPAADPAGIWRTQPNDAGNYLEVTVGPCAADAAKLCGLITRARNSAGAEIESPNVGRTIIADMVPGDPGTWSQGTIWAPDDDRTYRSNMELRGSVLRVEGCVAGGLICRGQDWTRVQ